MPESDALITDAEAAGIMLDPRELSLVRLEIQFHALYMARAALKRAGMDATACEAKIAQCKSLRPVLAQRLKDQMGAAGGSV